MPNSSIARCLVAATGMIFLLGGCTTTEPSAIDAPRSVGMERVTGAGGEHLGWVRTDVATENGGTYEVILDQDMNPVGYTTTPGQHYRPDGGSLQPMGSYERDRGLAQTFGRRAEDIVVTSVSTNELARSGPIGRQQASVTLGNKEMSADSEEPESDESDEDESEEE